jgi:WD40 repeat protein
MYTLERVGNSLTAVSSSSFGASPTQSTTYFAVNNDGTILALGTSDLTTVNIFAVSGVLPTVVEGKFSFTDTKRTVDRPDDHRTFIPHQYVRSIAFHPVFPVLATGSDSGTLELWWMLPEDIPQRPDTRRPAPRATQNVGSRINSVAFHPTELLLATGSNDKTTRVWSFNDKYKELICQATLKHGDDDI